MDPREELAIRRQIAEAQKAGDQRAELALRRQIAPSVEPEPETVGDPLMSAEMVRSVPSSAANYVRTMIEALRQPREALGAVGGVIESGLEAINPFMTEEEREASPHRPYGEAFVESLRSRYGTPGAARQTFRTDPVGTLADVSGVSTMAGAAARAPALAQAGRALDPVNLAVNVPRAAVSAAIPKRAPRSLYETAAKFPPRTVSPAVREQAVETALREGIMPTYGGIEKITGKLNNLDNQINALINSADDAGRKISRKAIYSELKDLRSELKKGAAAPENMRIYRNTVKKLDEFMKKGPGDLTVRDMQDFKTATYRDINWRAEEPSQVTRNEVYKALARGARKSIEGELPGISAINRQYGPLAELRDLLPGVAHRIENRNLISLPTGVAAGAGGVIGDVPGMLGGTALSLVDNPKVAAALGIGLEQMRRQGIPGSLTRGSPLAHAARMGVYQSGRALGLSDLE